MREKITLDMNTLKIATVMSEGNPGALTVLAGLLKRELDGLMSILNLDDMNIRGCQIWVGYKDHCKENLDDFVQASKERSPEMVKTINKNCIYEDFTEKAVTSGASFQAETDSISLVNSN